MHYLIRTQIMVCFDALFDKNTIMVWFVLMHYLIRTQIMVCFDALFDKNTNYGLF